MTSIFDTEYIDWPGFGRLGLRRYENPDLGEGEVAAWAVEQPNFADTPNHLGQLYQLESGWRTQRGFRERAIVSPVRSTRELALIDLFPTLSMDFAVQYRVENLLEKKAELYPVSPSPFSPSRYPHTYAYDAVRSWPGLVPEDARNEEWPDFGSRSAAAGQVSDWADSHNLHRQLLILTLASVYLRHWKIDLPVTAYQSAVREIGE